MTSSTEKLTPMNQLSLNLIQKLYLSKTTILMCVISPSSSQEQAKLSVKFTVKYPLCMAKAMFLFLPQGSLCPWKGRGESKPRSLNRSFCVFRGGATPPTLPGSLGMLLELSDSLTVVPEQNAGSLTILCVCLCSVTYRMPWSSSSSMKRSKSLLTGTE